MKTLNETSSSSNPLPTDKDFYEREFDTSLEAEMFDNGPESKDERLGDRAVKGAAWLAGIVGLFALAVVIAAAFDLSPTPSPAKPSSVRTTSLQTNIGAPGSSAKANVYLGKVEVKNSKPIVIKSITLIGEEASSFGQKAGNAINRAATNVAAALSNTSDKVSSEVSAATDKASTQLSETDMSRIEREALEVIHGDYGNNPGRAKKLGADYDLVQARVNQILHS